MRIDLRETILKEIKRLANNNDGKPPGKSLFLKETGIRESDWLGIHFARWGDALAEAGFEPNRLEERLSDDFVLRKLAEACRYYHHIVTVPELRMYGKIDVNFPASNTFWSHFGSKNEMVRRLGIWVTEHDEYADIREMLPKENLVDPETRMDPKKPDGSVYLIRWGNNYKIGRSDQIEQRIKQVRINLPEPGVLIHTIRTDDPPGIEAYWHRRFAAKRKNGEWFALSAEDVSAFKRRKFQ